MMVHSLCTYESLAQACCPCNSLSHVECGQAFIYDEWLYVFLSTVQVAIFLIKHIFTTLFLCFTVWVFSTFILFLCLLFLSTAAGRKLLDANCLDFVSHRHSQLVLHCRRRLSEIE